MTSKSLWCRLGFHDWRVLSSHMIIMTGRRESVCKRCGMLMHELLYLGDCMDAQYTLPKQETCEERK